MGPEFNFHLPCRLWCFHCVSSFVFFPGPLLIVIVDREGDRYLDDDDLLSSGQVSPLSMCILSSQVSLLQFTSGDYRPSPFKLTTTTNNLTNSNAASTVNVSTTNLSASQALNLKDYEHVLNKVLNNKKQPFSLSQTARMSSGREQEEKGVGEGEMDSDISELRTSPWKRKEKARFHSLLSVVDGEDEKALEEDSDGEEDEWEEKGGRKSLFDPRR